MRFTLMGALALGAVAALTVAVVAGAAGAVGDTSAASSTVRSITATGSGAALSVPNRAAFSFGVTTQAKTASASAQREQHRDAKGDRRDQESRRGGEGRPDVERVAVAALLRKRGGHRRLHGHEPRQRDDPGRVALGRRHRLRP